MIAALVLAVLGCVAGLLYVRERSRVRSAEYLKTLTTRPGTAATAPVTRRLLRTYPPRLRWVAPLVGLVAGGVLLGIGLPREVVAAAALLTGVLVFLGEEQVAQQRMLSVESQLVETIDMLIGSLRAGSSLLAAFEAAAAEADAPLQSYLNEVVGRIRLGDDPRTVLAGLPEQVPLETFHLFASALAVHWEVGGSLASTLSTVGRTIRDRIELSRRVRAQGVEAHVSVAVVMGIAYVLGFLMWRSDPERLEAFLRTDVGAELIAVAIVLQAVGLVWMSRLSRSSF